MPEMLSAAFLRFFVGLAVILFVAALCQFLGVRLPQGWFPSTPVVSLLSAVSSSLLAAAAAARRADDDWVSWLGLIGILVLVAAVLTNRVQSKRKEGSP